jgi:YD repeat-containing protein
VNSSRLVVTNNQLSDRPGSFQMNRLSSDLLLQSAGTAASKLRRTSWYLAAAFGLSITWSVPLLGAAQVGVPVPDGAEPTVVVDWTPGSKWRKRLSERGQSLAAKPIPLAPPALGRDRMTVRAKEKERAAIKRGQKPSGGKPNSPFGESTAPARAQSANSPVLGPGEQSTRLLEEIAWGLDYDPLRIFNWVLTKVAYVPYYGVRQGAHVTALEMQGNDHDQCVLLVSLLKEAGYADSAIRYVEATVSYSSEAINKWLNWDLAQTASTLEAMGISAGPDGNNVSLKRCMVELVIDGVTYLLDPGFKNTRRDTPVTVSQLCATYAASAISTAAVASAPSDDEVSILSSGVDALQNELKTLASNFVRQAALNHHSRDAGSLLGIPRVEEMERSSLPLASAVPVTAPEYWSALPDERCAKLVLEMGTWAKTYRWCDLADDVFNIRFAADGRATLYRGHNPEGTEGGTLGTYFVLTSKFVYAQAPNTTSEPFPSTGQTRSGLSVVVPSYASSRGRLRAMMQAQAELAATEPNSTWTVVHTLAMIGLQRAAHDELAKDLVGAMTGNYLVDRGSTWMYHQRGSTFTVDGYASMVGWAQVQNNATSLDAAFEAWVVWGSATEHLCLEQVSESAASSTMSVFESALRNGKKIIRLTSANWQSRIGQITGGVLPGVESAVQGGAWAFVPSNRNEPIYNGGGQTGGAALLSYSFGGDWRLSLKAMIDGGLNGGLKQSLSETTAVAQASASTNNGKSDGTADGVGQTKGLDPVDLYTGAFMYEAPGLTLGNSPPPVGIDFKHYYSSGQRLQNTAGLGPGWTHSLDIFLRPRHGVDIDLRNATVAEIAPLVIALRYLLDIVTAQPTAREMALRSLAVNWASRNFLKSKATVALGQRRIEFHRLADGSYIQSSNLPVTLERLADGSYLLNFRHGSTISFQAPSQSNSPSEATAIVDPYGNSMSLFWSGGKLLTVTDAYNRSLTFSYTGANLALVTDSTGRSIAYSRSDRDGYAELRITDPENNATTFEYDSNGVFRILDARSRTVIRNHYYGVMGRVWGQEPLGESSKFTEVRLAPYSAGEVDAVGARSWTTFDPRGRRIAYVDAFGYRQTWKYDGADRLVEHVAARTVPGTDIRPTTTYTYDADHILRSVKDPAMNTRTIDVDAQARPWKVRDFEGKETVYTYHDFDRSGVAIKTANLVSVTAPGNIVTTWTYDSRGRIQTHHPAAFGANQVDTYSYDSSGHIDRVTHPADDNPGDRDYDDYYFNARGDLLEIVDRNLSKTSFAYNKRRQRTAVSRWLGATELKSETYYDAAGDIDYTLDASGRKIDHDFDALGHLLTIKAGPIAAQVTTLTNIYDSRNLLWRATDALGYTTEFSYDRAQRRCDVKDPLARHMLQYYDADGLPTSVTSQLGFTTTTLYDARGLPSTVRNAEGQFVHYTYDMDGRRTKLENRLEKDFTWTFDDAIRKITSKTPRQQEGQPAAEQSSETVDNERGLPASLSRPGNLVTTFSAYDNEGRLRTRSDGVGTATFNYWPNGLPKTTIENGRTIQREYDGANRLKEYRDGEENTLRYDYFPGGELKEITYPDGVKKVSYTYDDFGRLRTVTDWVGRVTTFHYDDASRLTRIDRPNGTYRTQEYDAAGQLRFIRERKSDQSLISHQELRYDDDGRIVWRFLHPAPTVVNPPADTLVYDDDNRLATWNGTSVEVDANGNMTTGPWPDGNFGSYGYDIRNRLVSVAGSGYRYTAEGYRVEITGNGAAKYVVDPNAALSRTLVRVKANVTTYYVYGLGLLYEETAGATKTYHYDHLGSTLALTDSAQNVTDRWSYAPIRTDHFAYRNHRHAVSTSRRVGRDDRHKRLGLHARPLLQPAADAVPQRRPHRVWRRIELVCLRRQQPDQPHRSEWFVVRYR